MTRVRLDEVAADAGVSKATVSMVLNGNPLVAEKTRQRVLQSVERTGYVYNSAAASLRKQRSNVVGMVVTTLMNPYFAEFAESIQAELDAQGIDVLLGVSRDDPAVQARLLVNMAGRRVDGLVMVPAQHTEAELFAALDTPTVFLARRVLGAVADYVGGDNENGAVAATDHLVAAHDSRRVAFFGGAPGSSARVERVTGYLRALDRHGLAHEEDWCEPCPADRRVARSRARDFLARVRPDAVVCYNDITALGLMDAASERGLRVGPDLHVTGFDDIEDAAFASPPLTSVAVHADTAGREAAGLLLARIDGRSTGPEQRILATRLRVRASCGCAPTGPAVTSN